MIEDTENTNRKLAAVFTIGFHVLLFLFLFFTIMKTPLPPFPDVLGGSGLEVNFGNSDKGSGDNKSEDLLTVNTMPLKGSSSDNYITNDKETDATINATNNPNKVTSDIKINDPVIDPSKLYHKKSTSQGVTGGTGNQGKLNGDVNSNNYKGDGGSGGTGGTGGTGHGTGVGPGNGPGTSFDLSGRTNLYLPKPVYDAEEEGVVVVTITVDVNGNVIKAKAGAKGTNISNLKLRKNSEAAALKAKFNVKKNAAIEQQGTITYIFLKQN
jgi:hypothetical protein